METIAIYQRKLFNFFQSAREQINIYLSQVSQLLSNSIGVSELYVKRWLIFLVGCIIAIVTLLFIHKSLLRFIREKTKKCIWEYDNIQYLVSKKLYQKNQENKKQNIPIIQTTNFRSLVAQNNTNYFQNQEKIFWSVKKIEKLLEQQIVPEKTFKKIKMLQSSLVWANLFQIVVWVGLLVLTLWIYLFFRKKN